MNFRLKFGISVFLVCAILFSLSYKGIAQNDNEGKAKELLISGKKQMIFADFNEALVNFSAAYSTYPTTKTAQEAVYLAGLAAYNSNDAEKTVDICVDGIKKYPDSVWISKYKFLLASAYYNLKDFQKSSEILMNKAIERSGDVYLLAIAKYYLDIAYAAFEGEVPKSKDPYANLEKKKDFNKALKYFTKARGVKISNDQKFEITNNVAYCNFELKRYNQAISEYNAIISTAEPTDEQKEFIETNDIENATKFLSHALFYRGESYLMLYNWMQSRPDLMRIVREYSKTDYNPLALVSLAKSYIFEASTSANKDAFDKAWGYYDLFFADYIKHEKAPEFLMECANTANSYGFNDKAIKYWQKMLVSFPEYKDTGKASYLIGSTYFNMKKFEDCRTQFKSFLATFPAHPNWNDAQNLLIQSFYNEFYTFYDEGLKTFMKYCKFDYTTLLDINEDTPIIPSDTLLTLRTNWQNAEKSGELFLGNYPVHNLAVYVDKMKVNLAFTNAVLAEYLTRTNAIQKKQELTELDNKNILAKYLEALEVLRNLASKYSRTDVGAEAQYHAAEILEYQIGNLADAIKEYEKVITNFPYTNWYYNARQAINVMKKKEITVISKRMFTSDEKPMLNIMTRNIKKLKFKAYRLNLKSYYERHRSISNIEKVAVEIIAPTNKWETDVPEYVDYRKDLRNYDIPITEAGSYILEVQADVYFARVLVIISDIGIIVKQSPNQLFVFAKDEITGKPAANVEVLYFDGDKIQNAGKTNEKGILNKKFETAKNNLKVFAYKDKNYAFTDGFAGIAVSTGYTAKGYIFSDRSAYRPGDTVKFKGILRDVENGSYQAPSNKRALVSIKNPKGITYFSEEKTTTEFGSIDGEFILTRHASLGDYKIYVEYGVQKFSGTFKVEEYKKPDFMVEVTPEKNIYLTKEDVNCKVNVKYFFGKPVENAKIEWQLFAVPYRFDKNQFSEFSWFFSKTEKGKAQTESMQYISSGNAACDDNGMATVTFKGLKDYAERYVLQVSAQDNNRRWASGGTSVILAEQEFYALLKSNRNLYRLNDNLVANLFTVSPNNSPVTQEGEIKVLKVDYKRGREVTQEIQTIKAATLDNGKIDITLKLAGELAKPGHYRLHYIAYDRRETPITADIDYFVLGEMSDRSLKTRIVSNKQIYFEGETANFMLNSPTQETYALITFEGEEVLDYDVVKLTSNASEYKVAMKSLYSPNIFVKLTISTNHEWYQDETEVLVFRFLNVEIKSEKDIYAPGDEAEFEVKTTDQNGNPVKAELAVSLVDEAIYSLFPDMTPDMKPFFYDKKRTNAVNSFASYDWKYFGITQELPEEMMSEIERRNYETAEKNKEGWADDDGYLEEPNNANAPERPMSPKGNADFKYRNAKSKRSLGKDMEKAEAEMDSLAENLKRESSGEAQDKKAMPSGQYPQKGHNSPMGHGGGSGGRQKQFIQPVIRKVFRDTAAFIPFVTTDADGYAKLKLTLPDNLTSWRATARGITIETLVGEAKTKATVTKGVLARLDTPRFLNNGDSCAITGAVHNYLDEELSTQVDFTTEGPVTVEGASSASLKLKPGKSDIVDFAVKANTAGESRLTFMARSTVESDAEQRDLTINPFGDYNQFAASGNLVENIRDLKFNFPDEVVKGSVDAELMITPGYLNVLIDAMGGLLSDYGDNTARIVTQLYSACLTYKSMNTVGSYDVKRRKTLDKFIKYALLELYDSQNYDGTFGWYIPKNNNYSSPSTWITAYSLMSMKLAIDSGFIVDGTVYSKTANAVKNFLGSGVSDNEKAILGYAYALYYNINALTHLTPIYRRAKELSNLGTAALALALNKAGNDRDAWELVQTLMKSAKRDGNFVYWQGSETSVRNESYDKTGYSSYYSINDSITATAWAFSAISAIQPENELMKPTLKWLMKNRYGRYWGGSKTTTDVVHALSHFIDAKTSALSTEMTVTVNLNGKEIKKLNINKDTIELGDLSIRIPAENFIGGNNVLTIERDGTGDLNFAFLLKYYEPTDTVLAKGNLVNVNRYYFKYEGENASRGYIKPGYSIVQPIYAPRYEPSQISMIKSGDVVQVELKVKTRSTVKNLIVEDYLPAGCEVVTLGRNNAWQHMELRDNRVLFYLDNHTWGSETIIRYALRAINPGIFRAMPAFARSYYQPEIYGHSNSNNLRIFDEKSWKESPELKIITPDERYAEIVKLFKKKLWKEIVLAVEKLFTNWDNGKKLRTNIYEVCLYYQMKGFYNLGNFKSMVENYEKIKYSNPSFHFNLDDRREVMISYFKIKDYQTCSVLSAELIHDVLQVAYNVGNEYRSLSEQLRAQQYLLDLWLEYPDYAATSQMYYEVANYFASIPIEQDKESEYKFYKGDGVSTYVAMAYRQLQEFCAIYPTNELTDDAMYQCLRYAEKLKSWETALKNGQVFISRYGFGENESRYLDDVLLAMTANYYNLENWDMVLETAMKLVTGKFKEYSKQIKEGYTVKLVPGESPYKSNAQLFIAKVYHALGNIKDALKYYQMVATKFADAQAAIEYFTAAYLETPDSVEASPKDDAKVKLTHKNMKKVHCAAYKIDLLILFSLHKSLGNIRNIELTGIDPTTEFDIELKKTEPYRENEEEVTLPIKDAGVFLLIFTAEHNIHKTTVVIKSDLEMRIQRTSEYIRVYLTKRGGNVPVADAYVKIAHNGRFVGSGKTDSRGVFEVSVRNANSGSLGVVAQKDEDFAFAQD